MRGQRRRLHAVGQHGLFELRIRTHLLEELGRLASRIWPSSCAGSGSAPPNPIIRCDLKCNTSLSSAPRSLGRATVTTVAGVNFRQLVDYARAQPGVVALAPDTDPKQLQARLFGRDGVSDEVATCFRSRYDKATWDRVDQAYRDALELMRGGRFEAARWKGGVGRARQGMERRDEHPGSAKRKAKVPSDTGSNRVPGEWLPAQSHPRHEGARHARSALRRALVSVP